MHYTIICARMEVDRLLLKMPVRLGSIANQSPKAQISGAQSGGAVCQRIEDNIFHLGTSEGLPQFVLCPLENALPLIE